MRDVTIHEGINPATGYISTHTSHAGRDGPGPPAGPGYRGFLLTRPMRDVTKDYETYIAALEISTHTSHAGRDCLLLAGHRICGSFLLTRPMRDVTATYCVYQQSRTLIWDGQNFSSSDFCIFMAFALLYQAKLLGIHTSLHLRMHIKITQ